MKSFIRKSGTLILAVTMILVFTSVYAADKQITLKFSNPLPEKSWVGQQHAWWAKELEKRTNGKIKVKIFWLDSLVKYANMLQGIQRGFTDVGFVSGTYHPSDLALMGAIDVPGNYNGNSVAAVLACIDTQENQPDLKKELIRENIIPVAPYISGKGGFGAKTRFSRIADLKDNTIRVYGGALARYSKLLGMNPVFMPYPSIYEAMQRGTLDTASMALSVSDAFKHYEVAKTFMHDDTTTALGTTVAMNRKLFNSLSPEIRRTILDLRHEFAVKYATELTELEKKIVDTWTEKYKIRFLHPSESDWDLMLTAGEEAREFFMKNQIKADYPVAKRVYEYYRAALDKYSKQ